MATGINNAAHIGGMIMGALLAMTWYISQKIHQANLGTVVGLIIGAYCVPYFINTVSV
jgi:predicted membrane protein